MIQTSFTEASYSNHEKSYAEYRHGKDKAGHAQTWLRDDNVNAVRLARVYRLLDTWLTLYPGSSWVTDGDGRYGLDAHYLEKKGADVVATDISDDLLREGHALGYIHAYQKENAEHLSFPSGMFDFSFCKEAYHHFPRPYMALYEMLRVSKKGMILIEPIDREIIPWYQTLFLKAKNLLKYVLRKPVHKHFFEADGNFLYSLSKREIEKVALGLGLGQVVFKGINDIYLKDMEYAQAKPNNVILIKMHIKLAIYNFFSRIQCIPYNLLFAAVLKEPLGHQEVKVLEKAGFQIVNLPQNPYL